MVLSVGLMTTWKFASPSTSNLRKRERKGEEKDKRREVAGGGRGYPKQKPQIFWSLMLAVKYHHCYSYPIH